jgi:hypothetical protein
MGMSQDTIPASTDQKHFIRGLIREREYDLHIPNLFLNALRKSDACYTIDALKYGSSAADSDREGANVDYCYGQVLVGIIAARNDPTLRLKLSFALTDAITRN